MRRFVLPVFALIATAVAVDPRAAQTGSPASLVGNVEQQVAAAARAGERLSDLGDACLDAIGAAPEEAVSLCGVFLNGARDFDARAESISEDVAALEDSLTNDQIAAVAPVQARLTQAIVRFVAILDRLGAQVGDADDWMRQTADAWAARQEAQQAAELD